MTSQKAQFGRTFKEKYFPRSANDFVAVNHGAYGLHPKCVMDKYHDVLEQDLAGPDIFVRYDQPKIYLEAVKETATLLNCSYKNLALVSSDTVGINDVLRSYPFEKSNTIAMASTTFDSCAKMVKLLCSTLQLNYVVVDLNFPMLEDAVVNAFRAVFESQRIKLALFDTVCSMPGLKLPYVELTKLCKEYGVLSLVDGAHLIGLLPIDLSDSGDFQPDFYTSYLHKWLYVPRGCAVLYVDPKYHQQIQPMPLIHTYVDPFEKLSSERLDGLMSSKFALEGAKWFPSLACVSEALRFRRETCGGEDAIREYCFLLAREVADLIESTWLGAKVIENLSKSLLTAMVSAFIPLTEEQVNIVRSDFFSFNDFVLTHLIDEYKTLAPLCIHNGKVAVRFSCQIYNELSDFEHALKAIRASTEAYFAREK